MIVIADFVKEFLQFCSYRFGFAACHVDNWVIREGYGAFMGGCVEIKEVRVSRYCRY